MFTRQIPPFLRVACLLFALVSARPSRGDDETNASPASKIKWLVGPAKASMRDIAEFQVPEGYVLASPEDTQMLLKASGNPISGSEMALLRPKGEKWFVVFEFSATGYIKDADRDKLDADALLKSIRDGTEASNAERQRLGGTPLHVTGWAQPPKYNPDTHNLEWAVRAEADGRPVVNYNTRLLGRKGVMEVSLIVNPSELDATLPTYQKLLTGYDFKAGERYAEYRQGDKIAKYGLAALVTGGAAVVAVKTGLFGALLLFLKKGWKLVAVGIAACVSFVKRLFTGKSTPPSPPPTSPSDDRPTGF